MKKSEKKIAVYVRTNIESVESINLQINFILAYLEKEEMKGLSGIYADCGFSGIDNNRPEYKRLLNDVKKGLINTIIVCDITRLNRNIAELENDFGEFIVKDLVNIIGVQDGYSSEEKSLCKQIAKAINEMYKRDMAARRKATREWKKRNLAKSEV